MSSCAQKLGPVPGCAAFHVSVRHTARTSSQTPETMPTTPVLNAGRDSRSPVTSEPSWRTATATNPS